jgi:hypothetical protein
MPEPAAIKSRQQQAWAMGDYTAIGVSTMIVSELLCEPADHQAGQQVFDVATGGDTTALAAACRSDDGLVLATYQPSRNGVENGLLQNVCLTSNELAMPTCYDTSVLGPP